MSKVLLLLPGPDCIQLSNVHKYITQRGYTQAYTLTTVRGKLDGKVEKILIIGHGDVGKVVNASINEVADAIVNSGIGKDFKLKIGMDTCHAAQSTTTVQSALIQLRNKLKQLAPQASFSIMGGEGPTITGGYGKRLVIDPDQVDLIGEIQVRLLKKHGFGNSIYYPPAQWKETLDSATIIKLAEAVNQMTKLFFSEFRYEVRALDKKSNVLLTGPNRKKTVTSGPKKINLTLFQKLLNFLEQF